MRIKNASLTATVFDLKQLPGGEVPEIAVAGRSNVGKSTFINRLAGRSGLARASSVPGKTRSINFYLMDGLWHLVDLPGYGYARASRTERQAWARLIEGYIIKRPQLRGIIHLVDIRHPGMENDVLLQDWIAYYRIPCVMAATKADKVSRGARNRQVQEIKEKVLRGEGKVIPVSSLTGEGMEEMSMALEKWLQE